MSHRLLFHVLDSPARLVIGVLAILAFTPNMMKNNFDSLEVVCDCNR